MEEHQYASNDHTLAKYKYFLEPTEQERVGWSYDQTLVLIDIFEKHYEMFLDPGKRKLVWEYVAEDLKSFNILRTSKQCADKWKNLIRTYKSCKEARKKKKQFTTRFWYFDRLESFFGYDSERGNLHHRPLPIIEAAEDNFQLKTDSVEPDNSCDTPSIHLEASPGSTKYESDISDISENMQKKTRKIALLKKILVIQEKILKEEIEENKRREQRWLERMALKQRKLELQERKQHVFEKLLALKQTEY